MDLKPVPHGMCRLESSEQVTTDITVTVVAKLATAKMSHRYGLWRCLAKGASLSKMFVWF